MAARIWKLTEKQNCVKRQAMIMEHSMQPIQPGVMIQLLYRMMHHLDTKAVELSSEGEGTSSDQQAKEEREKVLKLKKDVLGLVKITTDEIMDDLHRSIVHEENKALLQQREMPATAEWQKKVYQAIIKRRHHMIVIGGFAIDHALMNHRELNE